MTLPITLPTKICPYCKQEFTLPQTSASVPTCSTPACLTKALVKYWKAYGARAITTNEDTGPQLAELWKGQIRLYPV